MPIKRNKQKVLFTIPWAKHHPIAVTKPLLRRVGLAVLGLFIFLSLGLGSGTLPFAITTIRCLGLPVQTSNFMGSRTLTLPGESGYGPNLFTSYKYCTKEQAEAVGYRSSVFSEEAKQKAKTQEEARQEAKRFSPSKVSYTVYIPTHPEYEASNLELSTIQSNLHTFMRIKKSGTVIGQIRELKSNDSYNICLKGEDPNESYCKVIGHDPRGREIKRSFTNSRRGWESRYVGVTINDTGIILTSDDDAEAVKILSSLQEYKES